MTTSVVMPSYNSEKYLGEAIRSVVNQTYRDWELIIVDDCSTDATFQIASDFAKRDPRITLLQQPIRSGAAKARNRAIRESKGRFVAFLDSDDQWLPEKLEMQLPQMVEKDAVLSYTAYRKIDSAGRPSQGVVHAPPFVTYESLLNTCAIGCLTVIYDTAKIGKVFMPDIARRQDYGLWLRILRPEPLRKDSLAPSKLLAIGIDKPLALYRVHDHGISRNKIRAAYYQWRIYRECEELSFYKSLYHFLHYAYHGYRKFRVS